MSITKISHPDKKIIKQALFGDLSKTAESEYAINKRVENYALNPHCVLYLSRAGGAVIFMFLGWDSDIFGFKIGRIEKMRLCQEKTAPDELLDYVIKDLRKNGYKHINTRIGLRDMEAFSVFEGAGFNLADIQITLCTPEKSADKKNVPLPLPLNIRQAGEEDMPQLKELVKGVFTDTRFVTDKRYPKGRVDTLYYEWVKNAMADPSRRVFVCEDKEDIIGFSICNVPADSAQMYGRRIGAIDLIAVHRDRRKQGAGKFIASFSLGWLKDRVEKAEIRTQLSNVPAINTFIRAGFQEITLGEMLPAGISLHRWF